MAAGLEAKLTLAVGARVMLHHNIDTSTGLVNGAIGTILKVTSITVTVNFDHLSQPYKVVKFKSKFVVMKNFYVYRQQFPLILAYAVTIHNVRACHWTLPSSTSQTECSVPRHGVCGPVQGANSVGGAPDSISSGVHHHQHHLPQRSHCYVLFVTPVQCLRQTFRPDLPLYTLPQRKPVGHTRKLIGTTQPDENHTQTRRHSNTHHPKQTTNNTT